jgi:hypothetical protein
MPFNLRFHYCAQVNNVGALCPVSPTIEYDLLGIDFSDRPILGELSPGDIAPPSVESERTFKLADWKLSRRTRFQCGSLLPTS